MLRSFRLGNHRSFADEQELLLMPAGRGARSVVPVTAIYGANASGKSNLIRGLDFMRSAVVLSFSRWEVEGGVPRRPFRLNPEGRTRPSVYVAELVIEGVPHTYGFVVDDDGVLEEWLFSYPEKRRRTIFTRKGGTITLGTTLGEMKSKLEVLEELTRPNSLFLSAAARLNLAPLLPVYRWFQSGLRIRRPATRLASDQLADRVRRHLEKRPENVARLVSLLAAADVGITDIRVEVDSLRARQTVAELDGQLDELVKRRASAGPRDRADLDARITMVQAQQSYFLDQAVRGRAELRFVHGIEDELFELSEESGGTRSWLELLPTVLDVLDRGDVMVVDEIDTSLHPLLTAQLIGLFQNPETNDRKAQLIVTTHDTSLLGTMIGGRTLDRDQVWFVQKNRSGSSELYPLTDFRPRAEQNIERRYLGGSYGAVPVFDAEDFAKAVREL